MNQETQQRLNFRLIRLPISLLVMVLVTSCNQQEDISKKAVVTAVSSFKPIRYSLERIEDDSVFLDSLRALPKADSSRMKHIINMEYADKEFLAATGFYKYRIFTLGPYRAEVVAMTSDFNTVSGSLTLLLFTAANQWVSTTTLASHYDEAGWAEEITSVQTASTTFLQQKIAGGVKEVPPKEEGQPYVYLGNETIVIHSLLKFGGDRINTTRLDSTYRLRKE